MPDTEIILGTSGFIAFVVWSQQAVEKIRAAYMLAKGEMLTSCISICRGDFWI